jgi:hypothetical protein
MSKSNDRHERQSRFRSLWLTLGILVGMVASGVGLRYLANYDPVRGEAWRKVTPRLEKVNEETKEESLRSAQQVSDFFAERRQRARAFAADILCLSGKWAFIKGYFDSTSHEQYLEECFQRNLFRSDELKTVIESAVARYVSELQGRENQLLVDIRADLQDGEMKAPERLPALNSETEFRRQYDAMLEKVLPIVSRDIGMTVTREVVSFVGSEIAAQIVMEHGVSLAARLGVSGGILGVGASSGIATFGVGLIAGLLVDMALDWVIRQAGYDPEGEIAAKVEQSLNQLESLILEGEKAAHKEYDDSRWNEWWSWSSADREAARGKAEAIEAGGSLGLKHQLQRLNELRSRLREAALRGLILEGGAL